MLLRTEQKAELLLEELVMRYSSTGEIVCDTFAGSGATAVAAAARGRATLLCEKDPDCAAFAAKHILQRLRVKMKMDKVEAGVSVVSQDAAEELVSAASGFNVVSMGDIEAAEVRRRSHLF
ncbi:MAG: DNA methyltransferase [Candidatus Nanopelagicaceae bacterium]